MLPSNDLLMSINMCIKQNIKIICAKIIFWMRWISFCKSKKSLRYSRMSACGEKKHDFSFPMRCIVSDSKLDNLIHLILWQHYRILFTTQCFCVCTLPSPQVLSCPLQQTLHVIPLLNLHWSHPWEDMRMVEKGPAAS